MKTIYAIALLSAVAFGQEASGDRITVAFTDPSRPGMLRGSLVNGCFSVEGYDGKEVVVEGKKGALRQRRTPAGAEGLRRLEAAGIGLNVEVDGNTVRIQGPITGSETDVVVRVPRNTSLKLTCMNGGNLHAANLAGDLELNHQNGNIVATNVAGSVVAHSLNGKVVVALDRVAADKPMSFSSLNGDIDVTLPADTKANVRVKSDNGETFTDFDVTVSPNAPKAVVEDTRSKGGKYRVKADRVLMGAINGGGPELSFKTLNGNIFLRKKK